MKIDITKPAPTQTEINKEKKIVQAEIDRLRRKKRNTVLVIFASVAALGAVAVSRWSESDISIFMVLLSLLITCMAATVIAMLLFFSNINEVMSAAELSLERLEEAGPEDHEIIAANMGWPEVSAYCRTVSAQGRKLIFAEANALALWIEDANIQDENQQLYKSVYGDES